MIRLLPFIALLWIGCDRHEPAASAVQRYFTAIAAGDCATLMPLVADAHAQCKTLVEDYKENGVAFHGVQKIEADGRDPKVTLVSAGVRYKNADHVWIIRAEDHDGRWKLRF